jgi:hypothetical protein
MIDKSADPNAKLINAQNWLHTSAYKLKDKNGRGGVFVNVEKAFGFRPVWIAITKVAGQHDSFVISVEKTPEMLETEEKFLKETEKSLKGDGTGKTAD